MGDKVRLSLPIYIPLYVQTLAFFNGLSHHGTVRRALLSEAALETQVP